MKGKPKDWPRFTLPVAEYNRTRDEYIGLCLGCGEERECTEPDAHEYPCEACGKNEVFGTEELLLMGALEVTDNGQG